MLDQDGRANARFRVPNDPTLIPDDLTLSVLVYSDTVISGVEDVGVAIKFPPEPVGENVPERARWPGSHPRVPFYVSTSLDGNVPHPKNGFGDQTFEDAVTAIVSAAETWNTVGESELQFEFAGITDVSEAADDGINVITFDPSRCTAEPGCVFTRHSYETRNRMKYGFDVVIYGIAFWEVPTFFSTTTTLLYEFHLESWILHEFGHAAGLLDTSGSHCAMCQVPGLGGVQLSCCSYLGITTNIFIRDRDDIQNLYGAFTNDGFWADTVAPPPGSWVTFNLDYTRAAGKSYEVVLGMDGSTPGQPLLGGHSGDSRILPVNPPFVDVKVSPERYENFTGTLDENGRATARMFIPEEPEAEYSLSVRTFDDAFPSGVEDVGVAVTITPGEAAAQFRRGEATGDQTLELTDAVVVLEVLFLGAAPRVNCPKAFDANDDGGVDVADPVFLLSFLFLGQAAPPEPFGDCGLDPTSDALECERFPCQ